MVTQANLNLALPTRRNFRRDHCGFWSVISERFDPHRKTINRYNLAGAAFGGVLGGLLADRISAMLGIGPTLFTLAASLIATTWFLASEPAPQEKPRNSTHPARVY